MPFLETVILTCMTVHIQKTPNPNALKFVLPQRVFERPHNFSTPEEAAQHPLAQELLALDAVYNVFMVQDFITINKLPDVPWEPLADCVRQMIAQYFNLNDSEPNETQAL